MFQGSRLLARRCLTLAVAVGVCSLAADRAIASFEARNSQIMDFSWDTPSAPAINASFGSGQGVPMTGAVTDLVQNNPAIGDGNPADLFAWRAWSTNSASPGAFSQATAALNGTHFGLYSENALRMNVAGLQTDFIGGFGSVIANAQLASHITGQAGIKTILLDTEYYPNVSPGIAFSYAAQPGHTSHTFAEYQQQARVAGGQYMSALRSQNPDVSVMLTYGYATAGTNTANWSNEEYGLLPAFIDGMFDQAGPNNFIYDGNETSYGNTSSAQYEAAYLTMRVSDRLLSSNTAGFDAHYRSSFGFWLDRSADGQSVVWDGVNLNNNYYTPDKFQFAIQEAAKRTDQNVWLHSEKVGWWDGTMPQAYVTALKSVRRIGSLERFTGTVKDTAAWEQHTETQGAVNQSSQISLDAVTNTVSSEADYTTKGVTVGVGGLVSVEVRNDTSTTNTGTRQMAKLGLILSNNSGGSGTSAILDSRALMLLWSNNDNALRAGINDANGLNQFTTVAAQDHTTSSTWIYEIERLSATSAKFTVRNSAGGAVIGTATTLNFTGVPDDLFISLFAQSGDATFDNLWVAAPVWSSWAQNRSDDWANANNWTTPAAPNAVDGRVSLGAAISAGRTLYADSPVTLGFLRFDNANGYQIAGQGSLTFDVSQGVALIDVLQGNHKINLPLTLNDNTTVSVAGGASLKISNPMTLVNGSVLTKTGDGSLSIEAPVYNATTLALTAGTTDISAILGATTRLAVSGGQTNLVAAQHLASLDVSGGRVTARSNLWTDALSLDGTGQIDLGLSQLFISEAGASALAQIASAVTAGQIMSSQADAQHAIGFGASPEDNSQLLVRLTLLGDANLDGAVDFSDLLALAEHYGDAATWAEGDFNHDGRADFADLLATAQNYGRSTAESAFAWQLAQSIPEPGLLFTALLASPALLARGRRHC